MSSSNAKSTSCIPSSIWSLLLRGVPVLLFEHYTFVPWYHYKKTHCPFQLIALHSILIWSVYVLFLTPADVPLRAVEYIYPFNALVRKQVRYLLLPYLQGCIHHSHPLWIKASSSHFIFSRLNSKMKTVTNAKHGSRSAWQHWPTFR